MFVLRRITPYSCLLAQQGKEEADATERIRLRGRGDLL